jgi:hypothetical protein
MVRASVCHLYRSGDGLQFEPHSLSLLTVSTRWPGSSGCATSTRPKNGAKREKTDMSRCARTRPILAALELLEVRLLMAADWFAANLHDASLQTLVRAEAQDGVLSRSDMLSIFSQVEKKGAVTATEFADLKTIVAKTSFFASDGYVDVLAADVVYGNLANTEFQGHALGNLAAGSTATHLADLVDKWFLGQDHPVVAGGLTYKQASGSLFPHTPSYGDVVQGEVGDCYFLSTLAETALKNPSAITSMFIVNGDGTYTVRFYNNGKADYVTVDSQLPVTPQGMYWYANLGQNISSKTTVLWVALAEKAYVQMDESGWLRADLGDYGRQNNYNTISGGYMTDALNQVDNKNTTFAAVSQNVFVAAFNSGSLITFGSMNAPHDKSVVGDHAYAVLSYNRATQQVTLFNPWGLNQHYAPGLVTLSFAQLKNDFDVMEFTV